jgi:hypothetical protein
MCDRYRSEGREQNNGIRILSQKARNAPGKLPAAAQAAGYDAARLT